MLFEYVAPGHSATSQSLSAETVWSPFPLQPLSPGTLTHFSYSVLAELAARAWYLHYDRLGFDPTPRSHVVRRHKGHVYFNVSLPAQLEAQHAALEPPSLRLNGEHHALAAWEKPGFLAGFKSGRAQKKIDDTLAEYERQMPATTEKARAWYQKTQSIKRWGQAEVLQIMEEIERVGVESMVAFLASRLNLGRHYARLVANIAAHHGSTPTQAALSINHALCDISGLVELNMLKALPDLAASFADPAAKAWLQAGSYSSWRSEVPNAAALEQLKHFMDGYGHRAMHEGEIALPRWSEEPALLMAAILAHAQGSESAAPKAPASSGKADQLLAALPSSMRKQGEQSLQKIAELHQLQSHALHALAYIWAGTRSWALAAAREAMVDKRLQSVDEVFLFELEEIKQLMTGEWNVSSREEIHALTATRRAEQATLREDTAPDLLVGNREAFIASSDNSSNSYSGTGSVAGKASGALVCLPKSAAHQVRGVIVATELLDSGSAIALPFAAGFVAAQGSPYDPFVAAALAYQHPVVVRVGKAFAELKDGVMTSVEVSSDSARVSQE